jgi:hypothetical protein
MSDRSAATDILPSLLALADSEPDPRKRAKFQELAATLPALIAEARALADGADDFLRRNDGTTDELESFQFRAHHLAAKLEAAVRDDEEPR